MEIKINHLSHSYGSELVLNDISLNIESGDFVGVFGHNGSGKSTLIKAIIREIDVERNKIFIDGIDVNDYQNWNNVGYVSQRFINFTFNFPLSVDEVLKSSLNNNEKIVELLDELQISHLRYSNFSDLSGGQQQRVFIARALLHNPKLIVLDEPFVGVDKNSTQCIYNVLSKLNKLGKTIIIITHQEHYITDYVKNILVLNNQVFYFGSSKDYDDRMCELC